MNIKLYSEKENILKPIRLKLTTIKTHESGKESDLNHPALICVDEVGKKITTLLYFHMGRGGMIPCDGTKEELIARGYDISGLHFDKQGAIRFKEIGEI